MKKFKIIYSCTLLSFLYSLLSSPKSDLIEFDFLFLSMITVGIPLIIFPFIMMSKADKFYEKAKKEGRTRGDLDRGPSPVEEEYKIDSIILTVCFSIQFLLISYFLWK